jgi:hypothetical protein
MGDQTLILKGFFEAEVGVNPAFQNPRMMQSGDSDSTRVFPESLAVRAFPRILGGRRNRALTTKNPRYRGFLLKTQTVTNDQIAPTIPASWACWSA